MAVGSDVNVGRANELEHFLWTDKAVVEDYLRFHTHFFCQRLQAGSIFISLATEDVRMGRTSDDVGHIVVFGKDLRQRLNYVFNSFIRREQTEGEQNCLPFHAEPVFSIV